MKNFLDFERRNVNSMLRQNLESFIQARKNHDVKCQNCGNGSKFGIKEDRLVCAACKAEIDLKVAEPPNAHL